ncbi:CehA/McbA family metallohydrolase [Solimonas soli]|uniref:CehA/McbA family metallohydrolase n=1 Tax=Solimonas soli TaxID=413479 RepID=UPI0012F822FC|nr:CehA/McbA family metallohydrolase [Solimonas soli]
MRSFVPPPSRCRLFTAGRNRCVLAAALWLAACGGSGKGHDDIMPPAAGDYALSIEVQGDGDVESMPSGIRDCRSQCEAHYAAGRSVTLLATPAGDQQFAGWSGACAGSGACVVTMDDARRVVARFVAPPAAAPQGSWLHGDLHVHDDHSSDGSLPRQLLGQGMPGNNPVSAQIDQAERVRLDYLALTDHRTYDQHYDPLWRSDRLLLIPGEEANGSPHATVHGAIDTVVQGASPPDAPDFVNLQQSIWFAHSQDANWVTAHPDDGETNDDGTPNVRASAQGVDLVEAWNRASNPDAEIDYCENRWNAGFRFGVAGGSDDHFIELWALAGPGRPRTQVYAQAASERGVLDALRSGRVRIGPDQLSPSVMLEADADGDGVYEALAGDELSVPAGTALKLRITLVRGLGDTVLLYGAPGRSAGALQRWTATQSEQSWTFDTQAGAAPQWYRVEVRGVGLAAGIDTSDLTSLEGLTATLTLFDQLRALASPIFVAPGLVEAQPEIPLPAEIGSADGARRVAGARGRWAGFADVAASGSRTHVVAETHEPAATRIVYRALGSDGEWRNAPVTLSGDSTTARFPRLAARGDTVVAVWQDESAGQVPRRPQIRLRRSADGGVSWGGIETVRALDGRAERPALALLADGTPVVVWQEIAPGAPFDVMLQVLGRDAAPQNLSREGKTVVAGNVLDARAARYPASVWPAVAVRDDGRVAVAWQDDRDDADPLWTGAAGAGDGSDPDDWQIAVRTRGANDGAWSGLQLLGDAAQAERHPALAYAGDGTLVAAWDRKELHASGVNLSVQAARSADGGQSFDTPQTLAGNAAAMSQYPRLGIDADGRVRAVWTDSRAADWRWRVMSSTLGAGGWDAGTLLLSRGINSWPATAGGHIVFASTRNAQRLQRDRTQQIFILGAVPP